jgi:hypothetical protein
LGGRTAIIQYARDGTFDLALVGRTPALLVLDVILLHWLNINFGGMRFVPFGELGLIGRYLSLNDPL